jgi:hypothetical protein
MKTHHLMQAEAGGPQSHFEYDWQVLAELNPHYRRFVEQEIERLGEDHITIRTQYLLQPIKDAGRFLSDVHHQQMQGEHTWEEQASTGELYVAGLDVGGEERATPDAGGFEGRRDSTVLTIGRISYNRLDLPELNIVHQYCWTGASYLMQYEQIVTLCQMWGIRRLVVDKTGLGEGLTSLLVGRLGAQRVLPFHFSQTSKSELAYHLLGLINASRCKLYRSETAPGEIAQESQRQLQLARYRLPAPDLIDMYVKSSEGHDDFLISLALCCETLNHISTPPVVPPVIVRPRPVQWAF